MSEETKTKEPNNEDKTAKLQEELAQAHKRANEHFDTQKNSSQSPTYQEMRTAAQSAVDMIEHLHNRISETTPTTSTAETMHNDAEKAKETQKEISQGADPLAAYAGYSAYAVPQQTEIDEHRNYFKNPLTYDEYAVSEDEKEFNVKYNLTELSPGTQAKATNNPNKIIGSSANEKTFSYSEKTSGNKTIITTEQTLAGTRSPSSEHFHSGENQNTEFQNRQSAMYVYDKDKKLTEKTHHSESKYVRSDSKTQAYNGQDMSGADKGNFHTLTEISAARGQYTTFSKTELSRSGQEEKVLYGWKDKGSEKYSYHQGETYREAAYGQNEKGEWEYTGSINKIKGDTIISEQQLSPAEAQTEFNRLKKEVNKEIKNLTGTNSLADYASQLGSEMTQQNLKDIWNDNCTPQDKQKAEQANAEFNSKYTNTPAVIVAMKQNQGR